MTETKASYVGMYQLVTHFSEVFRVEKYNQIESCLISGQKPSHPGIAYQYHSTDVKLLLSSMKKKSWLTCRINTYCCSNCKSR